MYSSAVLRFFSFVFIVQSVHVMLTISLKGLKLNNLFSYNGLDPCSAKYLLSCKVAPDLFTTNEMFQLLRPLTTNALQISFSVLQKNLVFSLFQTFKMPFQKFHIIFRSIEHLNVTKSRIYEKLFLFIKSYKFVIPVVGIIFKFFTDLAPVILFMSQN